MALTPENVEARFKAIEAEMADTAKKLNDQLVPAIQRINDMQNSIASFALVIPPNLDILMLTTSAAWSCQAFTRLLKIDIFYHIKQLYPYIHQFHI